ncbi:MAG: preprotein translocase subunit SecG [Gammaproteobacteria bacterium]|nr:preprotein translocase subunit SecG [Gammaproteobacteria bacterium]
MDSLQTILLVVQVLVAISLIGLILIQHGKGADAGAAFGSGASSTVFGSQGSSNFLTKATAILAFVFLANSLSLAYIASRRMNSVESLMLAPAAVVEESQTETTTTEGTMLETRIEESIPESIDSMPAIPESTEDMPVIQESDIPELPVE